MDMTALKIDAATSQLLKAIALLFEERDLLSVHSLACTSLQLLHNLFEEREHMWDKHLVYHYDSIFVNDEYRMEYAEKVRAVRDDFTRAGRNVKFSTTSRDFQAEMIPFYILEAMRCLRLLQGEAHVFHPEFIVFIGWYFAKYPTHLNEGSKTCINTETMCDSEDYPSFRAAIQFLKERPGTHPPDGQGEEQDHAAIVQTREELC